MVIMNGINKYCSVASFESWGRDIRRELGGFQGLSVVFRLSELDMCEGVVSIKVWI